jgi:hypothetical protein
MLKVHCRKLLMQSLLANMDSTASAPGLARNVWVLDAVIWISQAVNKLLPETVTKCSEKAGSPTGAVTASVEYENNQQDFFHKMLLWNVPDLSTSLDLQYDQENE